jgi:flagellin-specific chaperone FliS
MTETAAQVSQNIGNNPILTNSLMTRQELDKFKEIVRKDYGVSLSDEQAFEQATALLNLFDYVIESRLDSRRNRVNMNNNQK